MKPKIFIPAAFLCLLVSSVTGALPFFFSGSVQGFIDCLFESASGFTTTGATVISNIQALPKSIVLWRSLNGWLGGLAVFVLVPVVHITQDSIRKVFLIYAGLTATLMLFLLISGLDLFTAGIRAMGTISTSGFAEQSALAGPGSSLVNWVLAAFMIIAAINYSVYLRMRPRFGLSAFRDEESRLFMLIIIASFVLVAIGLESESLSVQSLGAASPDVGTVLERAFFQSASAASTTGFRIADYTVWPPLCQFVILLLMMSGGCAASPAGGIKMLRLLIVFKMLGRNISRRLHPSAVMPIKINGAPLSADTSSSMLGLGMCYASVLFISALLIAMNGSDVLTSVSSVVSCLGNVGPGFGAVGPASDYGFFTPYAKLLLCLVMIVGRLELDSLILVTPQFWRNS